MKKTIFTILTCAATLCTASSPFPYNSDVPQETWEKVSPYFLPDGHDAIAPLQDIFTKKQKARIVKNRKNLKKSGFKIIRWAGEGAPCVCSHDKLKGYLVKIYTDDQESIIDEWKHWIARINGAKITKEAIEKFGQEMQFITPKKWIYPIPQDVREPKISDKFFILVVEKINTLKSSESKKKWQNPSWMTQDRVENLFHILVEAGLDKIWPASMLFAKDKTLLFTDTEFHSHWPVRLEHITEYLPESRRTFWMQCIESTDLAE